MKIFGICVIICGITIGSAQPIEKNHVRKFISFFFGMKTVCV